MQSSGALTDGCSGGDKFVVCSPPGHKLLMRAFLDDHPLGHDGDDVRWLDGGQPVGDDDAGATSSSLIESSLHCLK